MHHFDHHNLEQGVTGALARRRLAHDKALTARHAVRLTRRQPALMTAKTLLFRNHLM